MMTDSRPVIIEHDNSQFIWLYMNAASEYVATACWTELQQVQGSSPRMATVRMVHAESDDRDEIMTWCATQRASGAARWNVNRTWPIAESVAPVGHRLHGKRDNARLVSWHA